MCFASVDLTKEWTGQDVGGVTVFELTNGLPVWVDSGVLEPEWVIIGAGSRSAKIKLDGSQFEGLVGFEVVERLAKPPESV